MKKLFAVSVSLALIASLCACGQQASESKETLLFSSSSIVSSAENAENEAETEASEKKTNSENDENEKVDTPPFEWRGL